jgi:2-succinyl-5-enolpyruvyl-6-hydroxy-3-cyclohexene-1-carboxylate synthase
LVANRGANGIDGLLSTAVGCTLCTAAASVLVTGDLAFAHDAGALAMQKLLQKAGKSLTVVLLDNAGGGIFEHLPIAKHPGVFEDWFATPQSVDIPSLCAAYGASYTHIESWEQLQKAWQRPGPLGIHVLHLKTDRKASKQARTQALEAWPK